MPRRKRGNIFAKLVVLGLVVYAAITLVGLHSQIVHAQTGVAELGQIVEDLARENAIYEREIQNRDNPEMIERIARGHGLVMPGERTFISVSS